MHTSTFLQKATSGWPSWHKLLFWLLIVGLNSSHIAWGQRFTSNNLTISTSASGGTATSTTYLGRGTAGNLYAGKDLGRGSQINQNTGSLKITTINARFAGTAAPDPDNGEPGVSIVSASLFYRVYPINAASKPNFTEQPLTLTSATNNSDPVAYGAGSLSIDLLNQPAVLGGGTYAAEIYYLAIYDDGSQTKFTDPGNGESNPYGATFTVAAPPTTPVGGTTVWQGIIDADWTKSGNWTNGVPTSTSDAVVQEKTAGSSIVYPILDQLGYNYSVRNLTLQGDLSSTKALLTVQSAVLSVYGNIRQDAGGLVGTLTGSPGVQDDTKNATLVLAGANQVISGALVMPDIVVGGSGIKSVLGTLNPSNTLSFEPTSATNGVLMQTAVERTISGVTSVSFSTTGSANIDLRTTGLINKSSGKLETTTSYVRGIVLANRPLVSGKNENFGNIGIEFLPNHSSPPNVNVNVKRIVGDPLIGPTNSSNVTANAVARQYEITKDDDSRDNRYSNSSSDVIFHYLPSATELNGIKHESYLTMYTTTNNGVPFTAVGGVVDTLTKVVTRIALPSIDNYTITLGDRTNPLPVVLTAFTATRIGTNAVLVWHTASEQNNKGFEVQVATDGTAYRTLTFVASHSVNSVINSDYQYLDTESGKVGLRYYRLHQIDLDGTDSYSPVRTVSFTGSDVVASTLVASPNPFTDKLAFSFNGTMPASGTAQVTLIDMAGRTVREQRIELSSASMDLGNLSGLRAGLYVAKIALPDGSAKMVRIQKQ